MQTTIIIMCHAGVEACIERHFHLWEANAAGGDIRFVCPRDSQPVLPAHIAAKSFMYPIGQRGHHGPQAIDRFRTVVGLAVTIVPPEGRVMITEYDAICLSPEPPFQPGAFVGSLFNERTDGGYESPIFFHPPLLMSGAMLRKFASALGGVGDNAEGGMWDRVAGLAVHQAGLEYSGHAHQFSVNTVEEHHYDEMRKAIKGGVVAIHGIKTQDALNVALEAYAGVARHGHRTKRIVSFSLYGVANKYWLGAAENAKAIEKNWPGWTMRIYYDSHELLAKRDPESELRRYALLECAHHGAELVAMGHDGDISDPMFWRFLAASDPQADAVIVRDADSRPIERDRQAVLAWLATGKAGHTCRDHPAHARFLNGGLWGVRGGVISNIEALIRQWFTEHGDTYCGHDPDQGFLCSTIWPIIKGDCVQHDSHTPHNFPGSIPWPTKREGKRFVGEVMDIIDGVDVPRPGDWESITEG